MIEMIKIEGGAFEYKGSAKGVSDFSIGKYPVTQKQWKEVMGNNPSYFRGCEDCPVENVSWYDVQDFIAALNQKTGLQYRLPTETEWEYAANGGKLSKGYEYAGSNILVEVGWFSENSGQQTNPVGSKAPNELGIYDMSGNVCEWCADRCSIYPEMRVLRGGSWYDDDFFCRTADRYRGSPGDRNDNVGFRVSRHL